MTLPPEKCVEIAEKVHNCHWRIDKEILERHGIESGVLVNTDDEPILHNGEEIYNTNELQEYIISWDGFGRTAEIFHKVVRHRMIATGFLFMRYLSHQISKEDFIRDFHLSALETLKDERKN